jgi:monofunctional biosynthetic peptidoglycan transglycosylase
MHQKFKKILMAVLILFLLLVFTIVFLFRFIPIPTTPYMISETSNHGSISYSWINLKDMSESIPLSVVAAEDANFCNHWGFDLVAIRSVIEQGSKRGASTISQQVVKNLFLWPQRSWIRKILEAILTPIIEVSWSKKRILEVYLNVAEFDRGIFGIEQASKQLFGVSSSKLSLQQAALLAAVLPNPKQRSVLNPSKFIQKRALSIADGAATILKDDRSDCFTD